MNEESGKDGSQGNEQLREFDGEATSKETLSDVAENEANTDASGAELDPGPSPDGAFDESKETGPI